MTAKTIKAKPRVGYSKDKILAVATRMFSERGFAAISIRDIAGECGISIPSIYHFFGDKENLYLQCCDYIFTEAAAHLRSSLTPSPSSRVRVKRFTVALCEVLLENHVFRRLLQRELLREERRSIDQLTTHHFRDEFTSLAVDIANLAGEKHAMNRTFSIYAMAFGLIQLQRIGELAGMSKAIAESPKALAQHILSIVLPEQSWAR